MSGSPSKDKRKARVFTSEKLASDLELEQPGSEKLIVVPVVQRRRGTILAPQAPTLPEGVFELASELPAKREDSRQRVCDGDGKQKTPERASREAVGKGFVPIREAGPQSARKCKQDNLLQSEYFEEYKTDFPSRRKLETVPDKGARNAAASAGD